MYPYKNRVCELAELETKIFLKGQRHYREHPLWNNYLELLEEINEISGVAILYHGDSFEGVHASEPIFIDSDKEKLIGQLKECHQIVEVIDVPYHFFWTNSDYEEIYRTANLRELKNVVMRVIDRMPAGAIGEVCGPITTGPGTAKEKLKRFSKTIQKLSRHQPIFDQMPCEYILTGAHSEGYNWSIFEDFYWPIFESGKIKKLFFMHGWQNSVGASKEHEKGLALGIQIEYLPENFV